MYSVIFQDRIFFFYQFLGNKLKSFVLLTAQKKGKCEAGEETTIYSCCVSENETELVLQMFHNIKSSNYEVVVFCNWRHIAEV